MNTAETKYEYPIDLVYLWCDMSDERWNQRREQEVEKWRGTVHFSDSDQVARYQGHDELRYSLRSASMYAPWLNNIYIVICDYATPPSWLNLSNPRIHIVRHSEIIPAAYLPCYNSVTIEHFISRIPTLSEHFLYANDDMFFFDHVTPDFFFDKRGLPIRRVTDERNLKPSSHYTTKLNNAYLLVKDHHPELDQKQIELLRLMPHHGIDAYRKSHNIDTFNIYAKDIIDTLDCPFRLSRDIQRNIYLLEEVCRHGAKTLIRDHLKPDSICATGNSWRRTLDNALRLHPKLFCLNASHENTLDDFKWLSFVEQKLYPEASEFEI